MCCTSLYILLPRVRCGDGVKDHSRLQKDLYQGLFVFFIDMLWVLLGGKLSIQRKKDL